MKERGLLLSKDLRDKSRSGEKTQTRRLIKGNPSDRHGRLDFKQGILKQSSLIGGCWNVGKTFKPQYQVGDHLYLQEPYTVIETNTDHASHVWIRLKYKDDDTESGWMRQPAILTHKLAARTWFEVTDVRVERLQDISEEDAKAEGTSPENAEVNIMGKGAYVNGFFDLWDSTSNIKWAENPWVFVYTYKGITKEQN